MDKVHSLRKDGLHAYQCGHYPDAEMKYLQALDMLQSVNSNDTERLQLQCDLCIDIADTFRLEDQLNAAQQYCDKAEQAAQQLHDPVHLANIIECKAKMKTVAGKYDEALNDLNTSLQIKLQHLDVNSQEIANCYHALSVNYCQQKKIESELYGSKIARYQAANIWR